MNQIVTAWQNHVRRNRYDGPDSVGLDDETLSLGGETSMPVETKLPANHFNNVIRLVKTASLDRVKVLKTATYNALKRLGVARDARLARVKVPAGSDQGDVRSVIVWMDRVGPQHKAAVRQIRVIDATCCKRVQGG
jgi:hypothetical protein